ncbi:MAG: hypothetical protein AAGH82_07820 [Pseudomonadota bacterium]
MSARTMKTRIALMSLGTGLALIPSLVPVQAQNQAVTSAASAMPAPLPAAQSNVQASAPDLSALRYYANRGEAQNYALEVARLRVFHPGWMPPASPDMLLQSSDENDLWALYGNDDLDGIEQALRARKARQPGWQPSAELREKVANKAARFRLIAADEADRWSDVLSLSRTLTGKALGSDIDLRWRVARAQALTGQSGDALDTYAAIVTDFTEPRLQHATLAKAIAIMGAMPLADIIRDAELPIEQGVRGHYRTELTRQQLVATAGGALSRELLQADVAHFEARVKSDQTQTDDKLAADDAALLGWYYTAKSQPEAARGWFDLSIARGKDDLKTTEGLILALVSMEPEVRLDDGQAPRDAALKLVRPLWSKTDDLGRRFIDLVSDDLYSEPPKVVDADLLQMVSKATLKLSSPEGAEALAWYAYNVRQYDAGHVWFDKALSWEESESRLLGQLLSHLAKGDETPAIAIAERHGAKYSSLNRALEKHELAKRQAVKDQRATGSIRSAVRPARISKSQRVSPIVAAHKRGDHATCLRLIEARKNHGADVMQMKGWCLMMAGRPSEAASAFEQAQRLKGGRNRRDSAYGIALAALRAGHTEQALLAARGEGLTDQQRRTISLEALTQRARAAFNRRDYAASLYSLNLRRQLAAEPRDLGMLRGWSHYHLGRRQDAKAVFARLDQHLSTRDTRRALAQFR